MAVLQIDDVDDDRIEVYRGLRDHAARQVREQPGGDMAGLFIAEGVRVIERGIAAGQELLSVLIDARRVETLPSSILKNVEVYAASDRVLAEVTGRPELRDPIASFVRPPPLDHHELVRSHTTFAILEGVNNPNNLGVVMRNAAGLGIGAVLLDESCGDPLYRRAIRASMGQVFALPHARIGSLPDALGAIHEAGVTTIALSPAAPAVLGLPPAATKVALLLGAEGSGLTPATLAAATHQMRIPMSRAVDSLNVASAAAIAFHLIANGV